MRLLPHILLGFVSIGLQRGLDALMEVGEARADLVMLAAMFLATCFPKAASGALAAAIVGLAYDLSGSGPIGLYAASLGLGGLAAASVPADRWPRLLAAMVCGVVVACAVTWGLSLLRGWLSSDPVRADFGFVGMLGTMLLTGLLALPVSAALWRWRRVFVIEAPRF